MDFATTFACMGSSPRDKFMSGCYDAAQRFGPLTMKSAARTIEHRGAVIVEGGARPCTRPTGARVHRDPHVAQADAVVSAELSADVRGGRRGEAALRPSRSAAATCCS
eukprot:3166527-Pyramimonas_sp.AAC.1